MTQLFLIVNSFPRDLSEFAFFLAVGFTAGSMGLIWLIKIITQTTINSFYFQILLKLLDWKNWFNRKIKS